MKIVAGLVAHSLETVAAKAADASCLGWLGEPDDSQVRQLLNMVD